MCRRIVVLVASVVAVGALAPATTAWGSNARQNTTTYVYQCNNGHPLRVRVGGAATITPFPRIRLAGVKFKVFNSFGPITVNSVTLTIRDPNNASAPYFGGAATGANPPGWAGMYSAPYLEAVFPSPSTTPPLAVPAGGTFVNAPLRGRYSDSGPVGTVISFRPGPVITLNVTPGGTVTCTLTGAPPPFVSVTE